MSTRRFWHDFHKIDFKIQHKLYISSGSAPPSNAHATWSPYARQCLLLASFFLLVIYSPYHSVPYLFVCYTYFTHYICRIVEPGYLSQTNRHSVPDGDEIFLFSKSSTDPLWGPLVFLYSGYQGSYLGVKWPGNDADYSRPSRDKVENEWSYTFAPPVCLLGVDRDNFTFDLNVFWISCMDLLIHNAVRFDIWISTCRRVIQLPSHIAAVCWSMLHSTLKMAAARFSEKVMTITKLYDITHHNNMVCVP